MKLKGKISHVKRWVLSFRTKCFIAIASQYPKTTRVIFFFYSSYRINCSCVPCISTYYSISIENITTWRKSLKYLPLHLLAECAIIFIVSFLVFTMFNNYHGNQQYNIRLTDVVSNGIQSFHWIRWRRSAGKNRNTCVNVKLLKAFCKIKETYITKYTKLYYYLYDAYALHFEFSFMFFILTIDCVSLPNSPCIYLKQCSA